MAGVSLDQALTAAAKFIGPPGDLQLQEIGTGNINDTFLVSKPGQSDFILQRLSPQAFNAPEGICQNLELLNRHLPAHHIASLVATRRWAIPHLLPCQDGTRWWCDDKNNMWRALSYIPNTITLNRLSSTKEATEVGRALAIFHTLVQDIPPDSLQVTIPHFHETPYYFKLYQQALTSDPSCLHSLAAQECRDFITAHQDSITILEDALARGELHLTTIHGDPKLANILFDKESSKACALIDLDTLGPGLLLYDLGDCLRSCCNRGGTAYALESCHFDSDLCVAILKGYLEFGRQLLTADDKVYLLAAIRLIPFELGLRFFTDYLTGCHYFKTAGPEDTLQRAIAQFRLVSSIIEQHHILQRAIATLPGL